MIPFGRSLVASCMLATAVLCFSPSKPVHAASDRYRTTITRVNDGDTVTLVFNGKKQRCRLIGIDAPETGQGPWGAKARERLRQLLKERQWRVQVEVGLERFDQYNRLLVYLWTENGRLINEQMLLDGYAVLFTMQPNSKYADRFRQAQRIARKQKRGIWGPEGLKESPAVYKKKHPRAC